MISLKFYGILLRFLWTDIKYFSLGFRRDSLKIESLTALYPRVYLKIPTFESFYMLLDDVA